MPQEKNIGIIGCGAVVEECYAGILRKFERQHWVRVVALCDPQVTRRERLQRIFPRARGYARHEEMFQGERIDLTIVASPPTFHLPQVLCALEHESYVFCEKPMTSTAAAAEQLVLAARSLPHRVAVGMPRRFYPSFVEIARLVKEEAFGDQITFCFRDGVPVQWPSASDNLFQREKAGGGVLLDRGSHILDQLLMIFGAPKVLSCHDDSLAGGVEANVVMTLSFPHASGVMQASWESIFNNGLSIRGQDLEAFLDLQDIGAYRLRKANGPWKEIVARQSWPAEVFGTSPRQMQPKDYGECFYLQLVAMLRAMTCGDPIPVEAEDGLTVIRCLEEGYRIAQPLQFGWLDKQEQEAIIKRHWRGKQLCA